MQYDSLISNKTTFHENFLGTTQYFYFVYGSDVNSCIQTTCDQTRATLPIGVDSRIFEFTGFTQAMLTKARGLEANPPAILFDPVFPFCSKKAYFAIRRDNACHSLRTKDTKIKDSEILPLSHLIFKYPSPYVHL